MTTAPTTKKLPATLSFSTVKLLIKVLKTRHGINKLFSNFESRLEADEEITLNDTVSTMYQGK